MTPERVGAVTLKGEPLTVFGPVLKLGDQAAEVALNDKGFASMRKLLESTQAKCV